jgi:putative addiction module CopG family antidote
MSTRNINLTDHLDRFVERQVTSGRYGNASEIVRDALRLLEERAGAKAYPNEVDQIKYGFKWSPLKFYHRRFSRGPTDGNWELRLKMLARSGVMIVDPIDIFLIMTIRSLVPGLPVYKKLVTEMAKLSWGAPDLKLRSRERHPGR